MIATNRRTGIHILESDPEDRQTAPSLLFIHGAGGNATVWDEQASAFRGKARVYRLELPGHGSSSGLGEDRIPAYGEWVRGFLEGASCRGPVVAVGHSMGGAVVLQLALDPPPLLRGIVLIGTGAKLGVMPAIFQLLATDPEGFFRTIDLVAYGPTASEEFKKKGTAMIRRCPVEVISKDFRACDRFDVRAKLPDIRIPSLILCGQEDKLTPVRYSTFLHERIPCSRLVVIPDAGHMVMVERPEPVNQAIEEFLSSLPA
ncbi:MAG: alpha/beta hydrolase [Deltaproteobacteria bacterium]|nr:alpha/beta hydrolase [Deltaproteobacteria bacterium]